MSLTVWVYDSAVGAAAGEVRLKELRERGGLTVHDTITISWFPGAHEPRIGHLRKQRSAAAPRDSVLVALAGEVLLPHPGPDPGTGPETGDTGDTGDPAGTELRHRLEDTGIDPDFLDGVKASLHPGSSALLVLSSDADPDKVSAVVERGFARGDVVLMHAQLRDGASETLRELLLPAVASPQIPAPRGGRPGESGAPPPSPPSPGASM